MKKILALVLLVVTILGATTAAFAASNVGEISPYYIGTSNHTATLVIEDGEARVSATLTPKTSTSLDKVNIRIELINYSTRETVFVDDWDTTYQPTLMRFSKAITEPLTDRGTYYAEITFTCYKGNTLIETIDTATRYVAYK